MENAIKIFLPVSVSYAALEGVLKKEIVGQYIPKPEEGLPENPYARILDIRIAGTNNGIYDIIISAKIKIVRTVLKRDQVDLQVQASLGYDNPTQQLFLRKFKLNSNTTSHFYNTALEVLSNKVAYNQIISKAKINLHEILVKEIRKVNSLLETGHQLQGLKLQGAVNKVQVQDISAQPDGIKLSITLQGNLQADIFDLTLLLPTN